MLSFDGPGDALIEASFAVHVLERGRQSLYVFVCFPPTSDVDGDELSCPKRTAKQWTTVPTNWRRSMSCVTVQDSGHRASTLLPAYMPP